MDNPSNSHDHTCVYSHTCSPHKSLGSFLRLQHQAAASRMDKPSSNHDHTYVHSRACSLHNLQAVSFACNIRLLRAGWTSRAVITSTHVFIAVLALPTNLQALSTHENAARVLGAAIVVLL